MFINLKLKLYRNIHIVSLPYSLFVFVSLSMMIVFYMEVYEVVGNRTPQLIVEGWYSFYFVLKKLMYILKFI